MAVRLFCVMGSGETAPTMRAVHADVLDRLSDAEGPAVLLGTPYGFQENAEELSTRAQAYFAKNVGHELDLVPWARTGDDTLGVAQALERLRSARFVFSGPGSPTYALRQWRDTGLSDALRQVLTTRGGVTFASAAAVTLGAVAVPVYEIYKAGMDPHWERGLDVFSVTGIAAAVIPHFDNTEGGTHDTRYCYLGERRLRMLEEELPEGVCVFGVDEHTACLFDLDRRTAEVRGRGSVTVRANGRATAWRSGTTVPLGELIAAARGRPTAGGRSVRLAEVAGGDTGAVADRRGSGRRGAADPDESEPLVAAAVGLDGSQRRAIARRDVDAATRAVLDLEQTIQDWSADTLTGDQADRARALLRGMVARLGELAGRGAQDPRERVAPYVEAVLAARAQARAARAYELADLLRDELRAAGVEVRDTPDGIVWLLEEPAFEGGFRGGGARGGGASG